MGNARCASTPRCGPRTGALGGDVAQRVVQAEGDRDQPVDGEQVGDDPGDRRTTARRALALEPAQPYGRVPLGVPDVLQQGVEARRLGVVRSRPLGHRDARRAPVETAVQNPGAQGRVQVEALRRVQQADRAAQPQSLVGAAAAVAQVLLDGRRLVRRAGGQRPRAEEGLQHGMLQDERGGLRRRVPQGRRRGQQPAAVLDGGAGHGYARRLVGVLAAVTAVRGTVRRAVTLLLPVLAPDPVVPALPVVGPLALAVPVVLVVPLVPVLEAPVVEVVRAAVVHAAPP